MVTIIFHGTQQESYDLTNAIARNCDCKYGLMGIRTSTCKAHEMLVDDQRVLDHLVFARRRWAIHCPGAGKRIIEAPR